MSRHRIVHLTTSDIGIRYLLLDQLHYLREQGFEVNAVTSDGPNVPVVRATGIPVWTVRLTRRIAPLDDLVALFQLARLFRRLRPALVHTHTPKASLLGQWAARLAGVPRRVHTIHGLYFPGRLTPPRRWFYALIERLQMAPAHLVLSQNREDIRTAAALRLCDSRRVRFLGNGIDLERFHPRNRSLERRNMTRAAVGVPPEHLIVGMVGRLVREKGYPEFFMACNRIRREVPNVTFVVVGGREPDKPDGVTDDEIARAKGELGDALLMLGHRDDLPALVGAMDLLVLPSHREGFPRVLMEAAATGVAVVATDVRGCREAVVDGVNGTLVPLADPDALADGILRLLKDDALRSYYGEAGRRVAEDLFDQRVVFARVVDAYRDLGLD